jgi:hypothetical protein
VLDESERGLANEIDRLGVCADDGCITGAVPTGDSLVLGLFDLAGEEPKVIVPIGNTDPYNGHPLGWYGGPAVRLGNR